MRLVGVSLGCIVSSSGKPVERQVILKAFLDQMELALELLEDTKQLNTNLQIDQQRLCSPPGSAPGALIWLLDEERLHTIQDLRDLDSRLDALVCPVPNPDY